MSSCRKGDRSSAMDHLATQVVIGLPADPAELRLSPRRVLARHEPYPGCKLAPTAEMSSVINTRYECRRDDGTEPRYCRQASACRVLPADRHEARIQRSDPTFKIAQ